LITCSFGLFNYSVLLFLLFCRYYVQCHFIFLYHIFVHKFFAGTFILSIRRCIRHSLNCVLSVLVTRMPSLARRRARICVRGRRFGTERVWSEKIYTTFVRLRTRKTGLREGEIVVCARARACTIDCLVVSR